MTQVAASADLTSGRRTRGFYGWRMVGVLAVTETVSWGVLYYAFAVFLAPMQRDLGLSAGTVAGAYSLALLVTGLAAVPVGRWLDRRGPRGLMTLGSTGAVVLVVLWSQVQTAVGLYLVFIGIGFVSAAVLYEPAFAVVVRWFRLDRARALLTITVVAGFASTIFVPGAAWLEQALGWRQALLVLAAVLAVTTVVPHAVVLRRDPTDLGLQPDGFATVNGSSDQGATAAPNWRAAARFAVVDGGFRWLTVAFAANTLAVVVVAVYLFPFLVEQGHSVAFAAGATGSLGALSVSGRLLATGAMRRFRVAGVAASAFGLQAAAVAVLLAAPRSGAATVSFVVLFGLGFGVATIARPALLADAYGIANYATLSALLGLAVTAAKVLGPVSAGAVRTATGDYDLVLLGLFVACSSAAAALVMAARSTDSMSPRRSPGITS